MARKGEERCRKLEGGTRGEGCREATFTVPAHLHDFEFGRGSSSLLKQGAKPVPECSTMFAFSSTAANNDNNNINNDADAIKLYSRTRKHKAVGLAATTSTTKASLSGAGHPTLWCLSCC